MQTDLLERLAALKAAQAEKPKLVEFQAGTPVQELKFFLHLMLAAKGNLAMSAFPVYNPPALRLAPKRTLILPAVEREDYAVRCWECGEQAGTCRYSPLFITCPSCQKLRHSRHELSPDFLRKLFSHSFDLWKIPLTELGIQRKRLEIIYSDVLGEMHAIDVLEKEGAIAGV